jgi:hypothetical protein
MRRRERREIPWKGLFAFLVIACATGYAWYQYERLHPSPRRVAATAAANGRAKAKQPDPRARLEETVKALNLTPDQRKKVEAIAAETTDPARIMRTVSRDVLTSEQREMARELRAKDREEAERRRQEQQQRRTQADARARRMLGTDYDAARRLNEQVRQREAARRAAAGMTPKPGRAPATPAVPADKPN